MAQVSIGSKEAILCGRFNVGLGSERFTGSTRKIVVVVAAVTARLPMVEVIVGWTVR